MTDPIKAKIIELSPDLQWASLEYSPTLTDVLQAIPKHGLVMHLTPHFLYLSYSGDEEILIDWNLAVDWNGQTDETRAFIGKLLGVV